MTGTNDGVTKQIRDQMEAGGSSSSTPSSNNSNSSSSRPTVNPISVYLFDSTNNISSFPQLKSTDPTTFTAWKNKFKSYCLMTGIAKVVFHSHNQSMKEAIEYMNSYSPGCSADLVAMKYKELHSKAFGALALAIEPAVGATIINEIEAEQMKNPSSFIDSNANVLWTKLTDRYEKKSAYATLSIFKQLISLNHPQGETPVQFRQKVDQLLLQLNRTEDEVKPGEKLSEGLKAAIVLNALPSYYNNTIQTLLAQPVAPTMETIFTALQRLHDTTESRTKAASAVSVGQDNDVSANAMYGNNTDKQDKRRPKGNYKGRKPREDNQPKKEESNDETVNFFFTEVPSDRNDTGYSIQQVEYPNQTSNQSSDEYDSDSITDDMVYPANENGDYYNGRIEFILDTGASRHIVFDRSLIREMKNIEPVTMKCALNKRAEIRQLGRVRVNQKVILNNVACVPQCGANLVSVSQLWKAGAKVQFDSSGEKVYVTKESDGGKTKYT